ncbi:chaplin family protein [Streptomyces sp. NPDC001137]|uniref:chaplin family protein n=1 Tax=Streptomyces sp. NPDC001137 TaxID=3154378 RepID=UPI00332A998E
MIAVAAASGAMALTVPAYATAAADGATADSPGVTSGNTAQLPVHVPANVCGNTASVAGVLNPAAGNSCSNKGAAGKRAAGGSAAHGSGEDSPGAVSGDTLQLPVHLPVNADGNTANVVGAEDEAADNEATNDSGACSCSKPEPKPSVPAKVQPKPVTVPAKVHPKPAAVPPKAHPRSAPAPHAVPRKAPASLAHTGTDQTLPAALASAALVLGGAAIRRRFRPGPGR